MLDPTLFTLSTIAFTTSSIAGLFGFAGGMIFIAALAHFLPPTAIIPIHCAVQLCSNSSRALLGWHHINWTYVRQHWLGSLLGITVGFLIFSNINLYYLPLLIATYILLHTWSSTFSALISRIESLYTLGAIQTGVSLLVGAPGPLPLPLLLKRIANHHQIVCTMAMFILLGHLLKLFIFIGMGFPFTDYLHEIIAMSCAAVVGSVTGTQLRQKVNVEQYKSVTKWLLTIVAITAITRSLAIQFNP